MDLACCHGNRYDVVIALKVLLNNRVAKIFIVFLHYEISFFGIFHRFTNTIATEKPFRASLSGMQSRSCDLLRTVPTIVIAHTFCASPDTRISYRRSLLIQGYFCAV